MVFRLREVLGSEVRLNGWLQSLGLRIGEFPRIRVPYFGVLIIRILLFRVLHQGPLFSETPSEASKSSDLSPGGFEPPRSGSVMGTPRSSAFLSKYTFFYTCIDTV